MTQVAAVEVPVVPTFKGFRKGITAQTDAAAKQSTQGFSRAFSKTGADTGKATGAGFKRAFEQSAQGASSKLTKQLEGDIAKASRALSAARLKEQDAAGKTRVAEAQLAEARKKYAADSSQVIRAQERMESSSRQLRTAHERTEEATNDLRTAQGELARSADRAGDELAEAGTRGVNGFRTNVIGGVKSFAVPLIGAFAALGIGNIVADAFRGATDFIAESISLASDLEQSVGGVNAVFGQQSAFIQKWAADAADAVGLSQAKYNEFATVVGAQLKNLGVPIDDVAAQTNWLVELGADLAAQYGGPTSDAVSALSSLLRGERDPIERYGVSMNEAAVKAEALRLGLFEVSQDSEAVTAAQLRAEVAQRKYNETVSEFGAESTQAMTAQAAMISANSSLETALEGTTSELTAQQKAQATLSLLMKQTADAQGAFARESDTLAGKQQRNAAEWENIATKIGTAFLPVASDLADILSEDILPLISKLADEQGPELAKAFADILPELSELAEDLLPLLPDLFDGIVATLPGVIALLRFLGPLFVSTAQDNGTWVTMLQAWMDLLSGTSSPQEFVDKIVAMEGPLGDVLGAAYFLGVGIHGLLQDIINFAYQAPLYWDLFKVAVKVKLDEVVANIEAFPARIVTIFEGLGDLLFGSGQDLIGGFLRGVTSAPIDETLSAVLREVGDYFPHSPAKKGPFSGAGWTALEKSGEAFWDQWTGGMGGTDPFGGFPRFPDPGGFGGAGSGPVVASPGASGRTVSQTNHFDKTDPQEAVELANQQLAAMLRGA